MNKALEVINSKLTTQKSIEHFRQVLPKNLTYERFIKIALSQVTKNPKLQDCNPSSIAIAIMDCAELGIEPDGRRAHLIPYGNTCQLIIDYKGLVELARRNGNITNIHADVVCENDKFTFKNGVVDHEIMFNKPRGKVYAAYAYVKYKDGSEQYEVMGLDEINEIRDKSKAVIAAKKYDKETPWDTFFNEMAKKTVFRRLAKWLTLSPQYQSAFDKDFDTLNIEDKQEDYEKIYARTDARGKPIPKIKIEDIRIIESLLETKSNKIEYINNWLENKGGYPIEDISDLTEPEGRQLIFDLMNNPNKNEIETNQEPEKKKIAKKTTKKDSGSDL